MIHNFLRKWLTFLVVSFFATAHIAVAEEPEREGGLTGTGIVGEVIALGSIVVNGQRITFNPELRVESAVASKRADALRPGDVVAIDVRQDDGTWVAETMRDIHPVIGPVDAVHDDGFRVLGATVDTPSGAALPKVGDWVAVSGFWAREQIIATRVETIPAQDTVSIQGSFGFATDGTTPMVGAVAILIDPSQHAKEGDVLRVHGTWADNTLTVTDVQLGLFDRPVSLVLAEGYLSDVAASGHYTVIGSGLSSYTQDTQSIMNTDRITVCGLDGQLLLESHPADETFAALGCSEHAN